MIIKYWIESNFVLIVNSLVRGVSKSPFNLWVVLVILCKACTGEKFFGGFIIIPLFASILSSLGLLILLLLLTASNLFLPLLEIGGDEIDGALRSLLNHFL